MQHTKSPEYDPLGPIVREYLKPEENRATQSFEYYAAQFLVGSHLIVGDLEGNIRSLAHEMKMHHNTGYELGLRHPAKDKI